VAFGTSTPELVVSLLSAIRGATDLSGGNVVGSNIVNILGILGLAALFRAIPVNARILKIDAPVMLFFTVMAVCLGWDGLLRRWEGAALMLCFGGYKALLIRQGRVGENGANPDPSVDAMEQSPGRRLRYAGLCTAGLAGLYLGGEGTIRGAVRIAGMGIPGASSASLSWRGHLPAGCSRRWWRCFARRPTSRWATLSAATFQPRLRLEWVALIQPLSIGVQLGRSISGSCKPRGWPALILYWRKAVDAQPDSACWRPHLYIVWMFVQMAW
jgi:Ca2+/Na+ antiporter